MAESAMPLGLVHYKLNTSLSYTMASADSKFDDLSDLIPVPIQKLKFWRNRKNKHSAQYIFIIFLSIILIIFPQKQASVKEGYLNNLLSTKKGKMHTKFLL